MNDAGIWFTITVAIVLIPLIGTLLIEATRDKRNK